MDSLRFYALATSLFVGTFAGGMWILSPRQVATEQPATTASAPAPRVAKPVEVAKPAEVAKPPQYVRTPVGIVPLKPDARLPTFHRVGDGDSHSELEPSFLSGETRHG